VITSNQAAIWKSLRLAGITDAVPGLGHLLRHDSRSGGVLAAE
jgi:maleate cis-trans isomerase